MFIDGKTIAEGSITADKISAGSMRIEANRITVVDQYGNARVRIGNLSDNPPPQAKLQISRGLTVEEMSKVFHRHVEPIPRTQQEIEQWGPDGLRMRDPSEPPKTDVPLTTAEEVW